jgi:hypothetical protein
VKSAPRWQQQQPQPAAAPADRYWERPPLRHPTAATTPYQGPEFHQQLGGRPPASYKPSSDFPAYNYYKPPERPDVRPVYRPPPSQQQQHDRQSQSVVVNSKAVSGLQRRPLPPPLAATVQPIPAPYRGHLHRPYQLNSDYNHKLNVLPPVQSSEWAPRPPVTEPGRPVTEARPPVEPTDTRWYRGDYQDAFEQTHEYYNLDVVPPSEGVQEEYEYDDYEDEDESS